VGWFSWQPAANACRSAASSAMKIWVTGIIARSWL